MLFDVNVRCALPSDGPRWVCRTGTPPGVAWTLRRRGCSQKGPREAARPSLPFIRFVPGVKQGIPAARGARPGCVQVSGMQRD